VQGDVAAPIGPHELHAPRGERRLRYEQVPSVSAPAESDYGRVLEKEHHIAEPIVLARGLKPSL
jgi:hypothetical protein